jgi:glycosyltransferase involved in cell wall biosynthesis
MKIVFIDVNYDHSSTGKIVKSLHESSIKDGQDSYVFYGRGLKSKTKNVHKIGFDIETIFHVAMTRITGLTGYFSFFSTLKLIIFLNKIKPDVVHLHELHGYYINFPWVMKYLKKKNIKTIWTFHCEFMYTGKCGHAINCNKWQKTCNQCPLKKEYPKSWFFDFTTLMHNHKKKLFYQFKNLEIVSPSSWIANRVKKSFLSDKPIHVINNGIDTINTFRPSNFDDLTKKHNLSQFKTILSVAPKIFSENKGGKFIINLASKMIDLPIKFIIIGNDGLKLNTENIIDLGVLYNPKILANYYSLADIFLITSLRENFPTTVLESLSCGTSVVGFYSQGAQEAAPAGYGSFVKYGDVDALNLLLRKILFENAFSKNTQANHQYAVNQYSNEAMYSKYKSLYFSTGLIK